MKFCEWPSRRRTICQDMIQADTVGATPVSATTLQQPTAMGITSATSTISPTAPHSFIAISGKISPPMPSVYLDIRIVDVFSARLITTEQTRLLALPSPDQAPSLRA